VNALRSLVFVRRDLWAEYAQSNTTILLCLTARILHVTPYHYKKHNGDDAHQDLWASLKKRNIPISSFRITPNEKKKRKKEKLLCSWSQCFKLYGIGVLGLIYPTSIFRYPVL